MHVCDYLLAHSASDKPAIIAGAATVSHRELATRVDGAAGDLWGQGVRPGTLVALVAENSIDWVTWYLAIMRCGAAAMPVPGTESDRLMSKALRLPLVTHAVCQSSYGDRLSALLAGTTVRLLAGGPPPGGTAPADGPKEIDPRTTLASVMLTSGSTGDPRGVKVSHRNIVANTESILAYLNLASDDRMMVVLPFNYCYGLSLLHTHLRAGGAVVLGGKFLFPDKIVDEMVARRCTGLAGVPSTYQLLLRRTRLREKDLSALRHVQQAGGRLAPALARELQEILPSSAKLFIMYGATEATARMAYVPPERLPEKLGTIGIPVPGVTLEILDEAGRAVESDGIGEIVASGDNITLGYLDDDVLTAQRFRDGRFYTGDLARRDVDGYLVVESRAAEFIKSYGFRVSPREIEDVLAERNDVWETLVVPVPDEEAGEAIAALVVPVPGCSVTVDEIRRHCQARLPNHKQPTRIELVESLPKNARGKLSRREAARRLAAG